MDFPAKKKHFLWLNINQGYGTYFITIDVPLVYIEKEKFSLQKNPLQGSLHGVYHENRDFLRGQTFLATFVEIF